MPVRDTDFDTVARRSAHADRYTVIALATRPGVHRFFMTLEHEYFPPGTPMNEEYQYVLYNWRDMSWVVVIIPMTARDVAHRVAEQSGMRLANGVPSLGEVGRSVVMGAVRKAHDFREVCPVPVGRIHRFPIDHERAVTVENDRNSPVYMPSGDDFVRAEEQRWIEKFWKARGRDRYGNPR